MTDPFIDFSIDYSTSFAAVSFTDFFHIFTVLSKFKFRSEFLFFNLLQTFKLKVVKRAN